MNSMILLPLLALACSASLVPVHHHGHYHAARSQFHTQNNHGGYDYGYAEPNGAKKETRHPDGTVTGTYSHPLPDGRTLTNNYVADEYGFRSNLAPTAAKDFHPVAVSGYDVHAPVYRHSVHAVAVPSPPIHVTKDVSYVAQAPIVHKSHYAAQHVAGYGYGHGHGHGYGHGHGLHH